MKKPIIQIGDLSREMNDDEFVQFEADQELIKLSKIEAKAKETAKAAILDRIGLTADELKTILG